MRSDPPVYHRYASDLGTICVTGSGKRVPGALRRRCRRDEVFTPLSDSTFRRLPLSKSRGGEETRREGTKER